MMRRMLALAVAGVVSVAIEGAAHAGYTGPPPVDAIAIPQEEGLVKAWDIVNPAESNGASFYIEAWTTDYQRWWYYIDKIGTAGPALSHVLITICDRIATTEDVQLSEGGLPWGKDGSTDDRFGYKWETGSLTPRTYWIETEELHPVDWAGVTLKAGSITTGTWPMIPTIGPDCDPFIVQDPVPLPPAVLMGAVVIGGMVGRRALRRKEA